jgi:hypothetical protein
VESLAQEFAITELIPEHFADVKSRRVSMIEKTVKAVTERLTAEIQYWDFRAADLKEKESAGKVNARLNAENATRRAEELEARLGKRLGELEKEKVLSPAPPLIVGGALVIPKGLLSKLTGNTTDAQGLFGQDKKTIEYAAMDAVMKIERSLGFVPIDVSDKKCGYDVESGRPEELSKVSSALRFIEVKGRAKGATTVTVTVNEIRTALNKPEEFILAIVEVDGDNTNTVYLQNPFVTAPDFTATSVNYDMDELIANAEVLYEN